MREREISIDINGGAVKYLKYKQYDHNNLLKIKIKEGNKEVDLTGYTVRAFFELPSRNVLQKNCDIIDNEIEVLLVNSILSEKGKVSVEITLSDGNIVVTTFRIYLEIEESIDRNSAIEGNTEWDIIAEGLGVLDSKVDTTIFNETIEELDANKVDTTIFNETIEELDANKVDTTTFNERTTVVDTKFTEVEDEINIVENEIIEARDNEESLNARLERDVMQHDVLYEEVEGNYISTDTTEGYVKDLEVLGYTFQDETDLSIIKSVGETEKVEGQELYEIPVVSCGKNLFNIVEEPYRNNGNIELLSYDNNSIVASLNENNSWSYIKIPLTNLKPNTDYVFSYNISTNRYARIYQGTTTIDNMISGTDTTKNKFNTSNNTDLSIRFFVTTDNGETGEVAFSNIQLEEGTVATPYEPYVEDKLTILSPTPLEKVGDVADRIICKDGVWGVEKNILTTELLSTMSWASSTNDLGLIFFFTDDIFSTGVTDRRILCDTLYVSENVDQKTINEYNQILAHKSATYSNRLYVFVDVADKSAFKLWLDDNPTNIKYATEVEPQFIPLPHDQQIKLRTFANKTNISFGCEIEGTIKAQVPKSIGATVNTHTEQISNLNKELDRVKKLEESTVSTVETESDFTVVEQTSNGYFEDVKLEGKTLVNLVSMTGAYIREDTDNVSANSSVPLLQGLKANTTYTRIINVSKVNLGSVNQIIMYDSFTDVNGVYKQYPWSSITTTGIYMNTFTIGDADTTPVYKINPDTLVFNGTTGAELEIDKMIILEGDHTQNPPSYFEGLKSVGDGADELVVSSINENLYNGIAEIGTISISTGANLSNSARIRTDFIPIGKASNLLQSIYADNLVQVNTFFYDTNKGYISRTGTMTGSHILLDIPQGTKYVRSMYKLVSDTDVSNEDVVAFKNSFVITSDLDGRTYIPHQQDKKLLLYYNEETQAWEKPVLREWDSIEKHSDGKYYYHQRSAEVVLNGSEDWSIIGIEEGDFRRYRMLLENIYHNSYDIVVISDKFKSVINKEWTLLEKKIEADSTGIYITTDILTVEAFKQWLQDNNVTVVYQLAEEKVYECTNIDLITYANETNYIVECGAIVPKTTLQLQQNIMNVVRSLQEKVSILEMTDAKIMQILSDVINN